MRLPFAGALITVSLCSLTFFIFRQNTDLKKRLLQAEERLREKDRQTHQVLHDLRSPLSAVKIVARAGADRAEAAQLLTSSADRILEIAESLRGPSESASTSVHDLKDQITQLKKTEFGSRPEVTFEMNAEPGAALQTLALPLTETFRVVSNLINNAMESLEGPGRIECRLEKREKAVAVIVQDSGPGFAPDVLKKVGRQPITTKAASQGHGGWGLFHAARVMREYGGEISIQNNNGAQVEVLLPIHSLPNS